jgi:hypothetical protein
MSSTMNDVIDFGFVFVRVQVELSFEDFQTEFPEVNVSCPHKHCQFLTV